MNGRLHTRGVIFGSQNYRTYQLHVSYREQVDGEIPDRYNSDENVTQQRYTPGHPQQRSRVLCRWLIPRCSRGGRAYTKRVGVVSSESWVNNCAVPGLHSRELKDVPSSRGNSHVCSARSARGPGGAHRGPERGTLDSTFAPLKVTEKLRS